MSFIIFGVKTQHMRFIKFSTVSFSIGIALTIILISGCGKSTDCLSNSGEVIREERRVEDFDSIDVRNYVNLILSQDSINKVVVESGANIINGITTEVTGNTLILDNTLACKWLRSYNTPVNVYISAKNLSKIIYSSSGNISSDNTITSKKIILDILEGAGSIDLNLNIDEGIFILRMGTADVKLHGICKISSVYSGEFGLFQLSDLKTNFTFITNKGSNDCYINVNDYLVATITSIGNIYYTGNPDSVSTNITGQGKLIQY